MLNTRLILTSLVATLAVAVGFFGRLAYEQTVSAQEVRDPRTGLDCDNFDSQAEAQAYLRENPDDFDVLDRERDGVACETFDYDDPARDETPVVFDDTQETTQQQPTTPQTNNGAAQNQYQQERKVERRDELLRSSGPATGPLPLMRDETCPAEFPVKRGETCNAA